MALPLPFIKIEHIGLAVKDLDAAIASYSSLSGVQLLKIENVASENVNVAFFQVGESKIELLAPTSPDSAIAKFIDKKGEGMHHIAYLVHDVHQSLEQAKAIGFQAISAEPKLGADNKIIAFLHPKSTLGVLTELCQERPD